MNDLNYQVLRIRMVEERIAEEYPKGKMRGPIHLSVGQEAAAVGVCAALTKDDKVVSTHRSHAHYLAKGGSLNGLIAELYGKRTGCSGGHGGSMHLVDRSAGFYGSTSIVGGTIPVGVGIAFAEKMRGANNRTVIFLGDGATEQGVFYESLNFTQLHELNVLFVIEDNDYSCYTPSRLRRHMRFDIDKVFGAHGIYPYHASSLNTINHFVQNVEHRPTAMLINCKRNYEHCGPNKETEPDPILSTKEWLEKISDEIDEAFALAELAAWPEPVRMTCPS